MYSNITNVAQLHSTIAELQNKAYAQERDIAENFKSVTESLKIQNIVKHSLGSLFKGQDKENIVNILLGLTSGFISRKLLLGKTGGLIGKNLGRVIQWGVAGLVSKNADKIKEKSSEIIDKYFKKSKTDSNHNPENFSLTN